MDVEKYCRLGISLVGMEALSDRHPGEITDATTTSDVCHAVLKPATVPAGWVDEVSLNASGRQIFPLTLEQDRETFRTSCLAIMPARYRGPTVPPRPRPPGDPDRPGEALVRAPLPRGRDRPHAAGAAPRHALVLRAAAGRPRDGAPPPPLPFPRA